MDELSTELSTELSDFDSCLIEPSEKADFRLVSQSFDWSNQLTTRTHLVCSNRSVYIVDWCELLAPVCDFLCVRLSFFVLDSPFKHFDGYLLAIKRKIHSTTAFAFVPLSFVIVKWRWREAKWTLIRVEDPAHSPVKSQQSQLLKRVYINVFDRKEIERVQLASKATWVKWLTSMSNYHIFARS